MVEAILEYINSFMNMDIFHTIRELYQVKSFFHKGMMFIVSLTKFIAIIIF